jgi:hypothetical protein
MTVALNRPSPHTLSPRTLFLFAAIAIAGIFAAPARAGVIISEVLFNEVGSDTAGEWIEIYNNGPTAIDLTDYKIGDEETMLGTTATETMVRFPAGSSIAPGAIQVVAVSATRFNTVYGFLPTYEVSATDAGVPDMLPYPTWDPDGGVINMSNTNDQALIIDAADALVDAVNWGNNTFLNPGLAQPVADGVSYYRIDPNTDTNTAADWALGTPSSPGAIPEPSSSLVFVALACGWLGSRLRLRSRG